MFRATIFDYNGVLVDDEALHLEAFRATLAPLDIEVSDRDYEDRYLGFDDVGAFDAILRDAGHPSPNDHSRESLVRQLVDAKKPHYLRLAAAGLEGFAGAAQLIRKRAATGPVVIVSGALRAEIELGLDKLGVHACVRGIVAAEDTTRCKPDPEGYLKGIAMLHELEIPQPEAETFVIEDSVAGVQAARSANLPCLAVCHSYPAAPLLAAGAGLTVPTIADVDDATIAALFDATHASP